ncbi:hypothetical protein QUB70_29720 [Microcoleus sp. A003_D6]
MPIPQKTFFLVERASCPFQNLIKRTFVRGLFMHCECLLMCDRLARQFAG